MKFSIQEEASEKQIFFTFREASEKTGIPSKTIVRVLKSGNGKYFRRSDKKTFWIQEEESSPFIQIEGEDFFSADEIQERFGISQTIFFNQLCKKRTHFLDSREKSHEVTWKSDSLERFLSKLRERDATEKVMTFRKRKNMPKSYFECKDRLNDVLDEQTLILFNKPVTSEEAQLRKRQKEILNDLQQKMKVPIVGADPI